ncbi:hypothetical protein JTE90_029490 [Oedothorax gibbosus]|uniref:Uncharacterized protein n=1 Tax=Oedothorax gibbosus TaxID=931172 RepID=A0AAV6V2Y2_9ARAC|nr:hypothetical protein JTE90_029490 [Oedothorax gibbosus]
MSHRADVESMWKPAVKRGPPLRSATMSVFLSHMDHSRRFGTQSGSWIVRAALSKTVLRPESFPRYAENRWVLSHWPPEVTWCAYRFRRQRGGFYWPPAFWYRLRQTR